LRLMRILSTSRRYSSSANLSGEFKEGHVLRDCHRRED
jgi:hypothetical protein